MPNPSVLNVVTLLLVLAALIGVLLWHRRKASNRNPMGDEGMAANHPVQKPTDRA